MTGTPAHTRPDPAATVAAHRTRDPDTACAVLSDRFKPHRMRRTGRHGAFDFVHLSADVPEGSFNILQYGAEVEITPEPFGDFFMLEMPVAAGVDIESAGRASVRSDPGTALFLPPHVRFASTWRAGALQLMLKVQSAHVLRRWQAMTGDAGADLPRVTPQIDLATHEGWRVRQMLLLLRAEMERAMRGQGAALATTPLAGATIDSVLAYYRAHHGDRRVRAPRVLPAHLRGCIAHIRANLASDLSVPVLLAHTGIGERSLFKLFRRFLGTTPMGYVRAERLKAARAALLTGTPVGDAARAVGFVHMGRFAAQYRETFGESPSATRAGALRR